MWLGLSWTAIRRGLFNQLLVFCCTILRAHTGQSVYKFLLDSSPFVCAASNAMLELSRDCTLSWCMDPVEGTIEMLSSELGPVYFSILRHPQ